MIPVTHAFAGTHGRGVRAGRARGCASAGRLLAGGAESIACDDQRRARWRAAGRADSDRRSAPMADWVRRSPRWCSPRRAAHPSDAAWSVGSRARPRVRRSSATSSCSAASAAATRPQRAVHRHHRHQRQIHHHGAGRRISARLPATTPQLGGNIGTAMLSLEPPPRGRIHVIEMLVLSDRPCAVARSLGRHSAQCQRGPHRSPRQHAPLRGHQGAAGRAASSATAPRSSGSTTIGARRSPIASSAPASGCARLGAAAARRRTLSSRPSRSCSAPAAPRARSRSLGGIGSLRGAHNAQNAACAAAAALALGLSPAAIQARAAFVSGPCASHGGGRPQGQRAVRQRFQGHQCGLRRAGARLLPDIFWIAGGKPKTGGIDSLAGFFPRIRKAYLIGEAAADFAATLDGQRSLRGGRHARAGGDARRPRCRGGRPTTAPVVLLSPACASFDQFRNFELRGDTFRESVQGLPGVAPA